MSDVQAARRIGAAALVVALAAVSLLLVRLLSGEPGVRLTLADTASLAAGNLAAAATSDLADATEAGKYVSWVVRWPEDLPDGPLPSERSVRPPEPTPEVEAAAAAPPEAEPAPEADPEPELVPGRTEDTLLPALDPDGLEHVAERTGIPVRALAAYAGAARRLETERPGCAVTWSTLAAIGYHESHHGAYGGGGLRPDGYPAEPIIGMPLDGGPGVRAIPDTDNGAFDGDTRWDRAVGPMQFIPSTWARWGVDASGSGVADPQHIDDAALAAARYLCASGGDLTEGASWWRAVTSYNRSEAYARAVLYTANVYAQRSHG